MKHYRIIIGIWFLCFFILSPLRLLSQYSVYDKEITQDEAISLLNNLYNSMQRYHPNIYEYTSKKDFDKIFNDYLSDLKLNKYYKPDDLCNIFTSFISYTKDSHSSIGMYKRYIKTKNPTVSQTDSLVNVFPFAFNIIDGKMYVAYDFFTDSIITEKSEIVYINEQETSQWIMGKRMTICSELDSHKDAKISRHSQYKLLSNRVNRFGFVPYNENDTLYAEFDCGVHVLDYDKYLSEAYGENDEIVSFTPLNNGKIALVKIQYFYTLETMLPIVNNIIDSISNYDSENLIIDLRESPGGHAEVIGEFIKQITDKPFKIHSEEHFYVKKSMKKSPNEYMRKPWIHRDYINRKDVKKLWKDDRDSVFVKISDVIYPDKHTDKFNGNIWVMVGPYTHSAAVKFAATIQDNNIGIIVGEESSAVNCYGNPMDYEFSSDVLNNKYIRYDYFAPHIKLIRPSGELTDAPHGIIPDIEIKANTTLKNDEQLNTLIEIINQTNR